MTFDKNGFELINNFISDELANKIIDNSEVLLAKTKGGGIRNVDKKNPIIAEFINSKSLLSHVSKYIKTKPSFVRAILFDKTEDNNWLVVWHQDKTIAVSSKFEAVGWGPWSVKDGVNHVQPPIKVLNNMVTLRIHLDDTNLLNGCLKVIPKSHHAGLLTKDEIRHFVEDNQSKIIEAPRLSALIMRPHLLHASSKASKPSRRRVLHFEFCGVESENLISREQRKDFNEY